MVTSLKTDFAQIFSRCPKNLSCQKFGGAAAPLAPPARTPMEIKLTIWQSKSFWVQSHVQAMSKVGKCKESEGRRLRKSLSQ